MNRSFENAAAPVARRALVLCHPGANERLDGTAAWLDERRLDFHLHVRDAVPNDLDRLARVTARCTRPASRSTGSAVRASAP